MRDRYPRDREIMVAREERRGSGNCSDLDAEQVSKPWGYYKQLAVVPGDKAFPSAKDSGCPLTK
jgi:hypothetical protein